MIRKRLPLLVPAIVVFAAAVSGTAVMGDSNQSNHACAGTSLDMTSGDDTSSVDLVVLVNGSSDVSINQHISQSNGRSHVDIDVEYGDEQLTIAGETTKNGTLVLNVTGEDTVVIESVVVNESTDHVIVFHIDRNGDVRISRKENASECLCDTDAAESNVNDGMNRVSVDGTRNPVHTQPESKFGEY